MRFHRGRAVATSARRLAHRAESTLSVIVTKDEDVAVRARLRPGPPVVWIRVGNTRNADLVRRAAALWPRVIEALTRGETLIDPS